MKKRKMSVTISLDQDMLDRIENYMGNIKHGAFSVFVRDAIEYYLNEKENVATVSIDDSIPSSDSVVPSEQPPDTNQDSDITPNNKNKDFNWNDVNIS